MTKRKPLPPLTVQQAVTLADTIIPMITIDVRRAIENMEMLEGSNGVVSTLDGVKTPAAIGHGISMNAFRVMLALDVSRLFDVVSNNRDKASLPQLAVLLARPDVGAEIVNRHQPHGGYWHRRAVTALRHFQRGWNTLEASTADQDALRRLRALRDYEIAHTIHGKPPAAPTYGEIFRLVRIARLLATQGERLTYDGNSDLSLFMRDSRCQANEFWDRFVAA
jgi:hypothetical protein